MQAETCVSDGEKEKKVEYHQHCSGKTNHEQ